MAISERTRKILWVMAGGRCSICRVQLVTEATDTDDPAVFGQEAHIVAQAGRGPRAGQVAEIDGYENLILLCSKDHKRVDDQVAYYTVPRLRQIKRAHEQWIRSLVGPAGEDHASNRERLRARAQEVRRGAAEMARERQEALHLRYLDHWREGITTAAVVTWLDGQGREHRRIVAGETEALTLLGMIEADRTLRMISCDLS